MSLFSKILEKLGLKKDKPADASAKPISGTAGVSAKPGVRPSQAGGQYVPGGSVPAAPTPISEVDVVKKLEQLGAGTDLDWKVSIMDLLKLLKIDSSREARSELATELGCPADLMKDSVKMNAWLHKEVLRKIAANGGNIPKQLLD